MRKTFMDNFSEIKQYVTDIKTDQIADKTNFAFQFEILGEGNGIFYIAYRNDNLSIEPYDYYDNSARIQASADIITGLMQGRITINETIRLGDINIISNVSDGVKKVISFFDACYNSQESSDYSLFEPSTITNTTSITAFPSESTSCRAAFIFSMCFLSAVELSPIPGVSKI